MDPEATRNAIHQLLQEKYLPRAGLQEIGPDDVLFEGVLDSLGVLELIAFLERRFHVSFDAKDLTWENLSTVNRIVEAVVRLQQATMP